MKLRASGVLIVFLITGATWGQPGPQQPEFEVASIRLGKPDTPSLEIRSPKLSAAPGSNVTFGNMSVQELIMQAYGIAYGQISGPDWLTAAGPASRGQNRFDVVAKIPENASGGQVPLMLRTLLEKRFKLAVHREKKTMEVYSLEVAKGGPKLRESARGNSETGCMRSLGGRPGATLIATCRGAGMSDLARQLPVWATAYFPDGPVLDETGLPGTYDFELSWVTRPEIDAGAEGPTIIDALQRQLGLRIEHRGEPVEVLVIDHCEKLPTEN
jgi:uncharacterized protein (TIGR03435 family)